MPRNSKPDMPAKDNFTRANRRRLHKAAQEFGRIGGRAGTGKSKARTRKLAQKAARKRWDNYNHMHEAFP